MVKLPIQFPDPLDQAIRRADDFQRQPLDERIRQLFDVVETGRVIARLGDNQAVRAQLSAEREAEWQRIQKKWFARHGL